MRKAKIQILLPLFFLLFSVFTLFVQVSPVLAQDGKAAVNDSTKTEDKNNANSAFDGVDLGKDSVELNLSNKITLESGKTVKEAFSKPADMVNLIIRVVFIASGIVLFALVVAAGFTLAMGSDSGNMDKAKTTLTGALTGFIIMFAAYWIMQIISMVTGANIGF
jgi:capsular polysaccharide biosynthesis protein